ncbi:MAG: hypothetical protein LBS26_02270 [Campylobacteraceae bacterium]|nr:hypothetical protein [Campylobacteraceae bacterium]
MSASLTNLGALASLKFKAFFLFFGFALIYCGGGEIGDGGDDGLDISAIAAGYQHSLALTNDGKVYATGGNYRGQLGLNDSGRGTNRSNFTKVEF